MDICPTYISKHNSHREKIILLIILKAEGWHYLAVKKLAALLRRITAKDNDNFFCLSCLHSFRTKHKLESHKKVCENKDFCEVVMPSEYSKILEFNQHLISDKMLYTIYGDLASLIKKIYECKKKFEKTFTTKVGEHILRGTQSL